MFFSRARLVVLALLLASLGASLPHGAARLMKAPGPAPISAEKGLEMILRDALPRSPAETSAPSPEARPLTEAEAGALLAPLPALRADESAPEQARLPQASLPPPRAGVTRLAPFPPTATAATPAVPATTSEPLRIVRHSPDGEVETAPGVTLVFSQAMVPLSSIGRVAEEAIPATLSPEPPGRWRWLDTRTLLFEPRGGERMPAATRYEVSAPAGTRSAIGGVLAADERFSFATPAPRVLRFMPEGGPTELSPVMAMLFDQRVDPATIVSLLRVSAGGTTVTVEPFDFAPASELGSHPTDEQGAEVVAWLGGDRRERCVAFRATRPFPAAAKITVTLPKGAPSFEGPLTTSEEQSFSFETHGPLELVKAECGWGGPCRPSMPWQLQFTNALDDASLEEGVVRVTPTLPDMTARVAGSTLLVEGTMKARTTYDIRVSPRLADVFGQHPAREIRARISVAEDLPRLELAGQPFIVVPASKAPQLSVFSSRHAALRVRTWHVEPSDWNAVGAAVRRAQQRQGRSPELAGKTPRESTIRVTGSLDELVETKIPLTEALGGERGHVLVSVEPAGSADSNARVLAWVQVTSIGLDALVDPRRLVAWATDLASGSPLPGAALSIEPDGGSATADPDGLASFDLRAGDSGPRMLVARVGEDVAFLPESPWWGWEGQRSGWQRREQAPTLAAHVLDDRGVYRPGESAHVRGWLRRVSQALGGGVELATGESIAWTLFDSVRNEVARGTTPLSATSAFALEVALPDGMNLGHASLEMRLEGVGEFSHSLRVEEFRRPEYEVSVEAEPGPHVVGGSTALRARASYYAGGGLPDSEITWNLTARPAQFHPPGWADFTFGRFRPWWGRFAWGWQEEPARTWSHSGRTDDNGEHALELVFESVSPAEPTSVEAEATVMDVNRQGWSARTTLLVHASPLQVGGRLPKSFLERGQSLPVEMIVTDVDGKAVADRMIEVRATRAGWRQVKGEWKEVEEDAVECRAVSADEPVACDLRLDSAGSWTLRLRVEDERGRANETTLMAWVSGAETMPDRRLAEQEAELIPDKKEHAVGETARLMLRSPFAPAEALLTLRRGGILSERRVKIEQASTIVEIPIEPGWEPGLTASVLLTGGSAGRPAFARASIELAIPPKRHELHVEARPAEAVVAPGARTSVELSVTDAQGRPASGGELTLIVADEAVLALTGYELADPLATFFPSRGEDVAELRSRRHVILPGAQRVTSGDDELGLGGGASARDGYLMKSMQPMAMAADMAPAPSASPAPGSPVALRTDLSALALFEPAVRLDADGRARVEFKLPDSLTRWRVMAIASSGVSGFGRAESALTARKLLMVRPSPPRFLNVGDRMNLPIVVQNLRDEPVTARVAVRLSGASLEGAPAREVTIPASDRVEVLFPVAATRPGTVRLQAIASAGEHSDAVELAWPTWTPATTEAFATHGVLDTGAVAQPLAVPDDALPDYGGLEVTTSSTALAELGDAVLYLDRYPFDCSEQVASRILGIAALRDVVKAFSGLPNEAEIDAALARDVKVLLDRQRPDGSFGLWRRKREPREWPYVSLHATHALVRARAKGVSVDAQALDRALVFTRSVTMKHAQECGPAARATMAAYALHVRRLAGDPAPAATRDIVRELGDALPLEALAWLLPVIAADPKAGAEVSKLRQRLLNHVVETPSAASFATSTSELGDDAYLVMHSNRRIDGIALEALLESDSNSRPGEKESDSISAKLVRGLLDHRVAGRWSNTQENAFVLLALDRYFRAHESVVPHFVATTWLGTTPLQHETFRGRTTDRRQTNIPLAQLASLAEDKPSVVLAKDGPGRLYYRLGLRYAPKSLSLPPAEHGFRVERSYEAVTDPADVRRDPDGTWHVRAGALVRVRVVVAAPARRTHVAVVDPLPAGLEIVNSGLATSQQLVEPAPDQSLDGPQPMGKRGFAAGAVITRPAWPGGWAEHENLRDDRAESFTSLFWEGEQTQVHLCRAATPGRFVAPPAKVEEMYHPEVFGRSGSDVVVVE